MYSVLSNGEVSNGENDSTPSFFQEYKYKLEKLYDNFYTQRGGELAKKRQQAAIQFYNHMYEEVKDSYGNGKEELAKLIQ